VPPAETSPAEARAETPPPVPPSLELEQLQEAWRRTVVPAVEQRSMPTAAILTEAHPAALAGDTLTLEFAPQAKFHLDKAEEPRNVELLHDALYEVTGRRLSLVFALGEEREHSADEAEPEGEENFVELMKRTFDAEELGPE
jgi:hypothetical protein